MNYYHDSIMCLSFQLSTNMKDYIFEENLLRVKEILSRKVYYQFAFGATYFCVKSLNFVWTCVDLVHIMFKIYKDKQNGNAWQNPQSHKGISHEGSLYEQKAIKIDDFNETEAKKLKRAMQKEKEKEEK